jgi:Spherulation-specific family 4
MRPLLCHLVGLLTALLPCAALATEPPAVQLLVPAYFYPSGWTQVYWDQLVTAASKAPIVAIVNPASGPGATVDPKYTSVVNRLRAIDGIFLDEMGNDGSAASLGYYASLYQYIKGPNADWQVIGNPWDTLPDWWAQLVSEVCFANGQSAC